MKIEITGREYRIDDKLKTLLLKKLKRLDKLFGEETPARHVLSQTSSGYVMEFTVFGEKTIRAEAVSADMYGNIDILIPRIKRQFRKEQTKVISQREG